VACIGHSAYRYGIYQTRSRSTVSSRLKEKEEPVLHTVHRSVCRRLNIAAHTYTPVAVSSSSLAEAYTMGKIDHLRSIDRDRDWNQITVVNESSAVSEMGDRVATIDMR